MPSSSRSRSVLMPRRMRVQLAIQMACTPARYAAREPSLEDLRAMYCAFVALWFRYQQTHSPACTLAMPHSHS